jgi:peptidyl-prolyl cis-trans isomerase C
MNQTSSQQTTEAAADITFPTVTVNGKVIESATIASEMQYHPAKSAENALLEAVRALIIKQLLLSEAGNNDKAETDIEGASNDMEQTISHLLESKTCPAIATEGECRQYYQMNETRFVSEPLIAARHILLAAAPNDMEERLTVQQQATEIVDRLKEDPGHFASLAKLHSVCPSKETGGSLGQLSRGQTTPEFERQVFSLSEGLAQSPVESRYGYHIVDIEKRVEGEQLPFDMVKAKINRYLNERAQRKAISVYIRDLIDKADIDGVEKEAISPSYDNA